MKLDKGIEDVHEAESELARELYRVGERHAADPDILHLSHTLAKRCAEHLRRLAPFAERYGAPAAPKDLGPPGGLVQALRRKGSELTAHSEKSGTLLLADLRKLYLAAHEAEIAWVILSQGALAARDAELIDLIRTCQEEAQHRWQWVRTRIKETSPQVLAGS